MKSYLVRKNTKALAMNIFTEKRSSLYYTKRENYFTETITDPIRYRNGQYVTPKILATSPRVCEIFNRLAEDGWYVFPDMYSNSGWVLVVPAEDVTTQ